MDFSPFNDLSAELRNRIYEFVLCTPQPIEILLADMHHPACGPRLRPRPHSDNAIRVKAMPKDTEVDNENRLQFPGSRTAVRNDLKHLVGLVDTLALTMTCRQIRYEALSVFLGENMFKIHAYSAIGSAEEDDVPLIARTIFRWCTSFGPYVTCMRNWEICLGDSYEDDRSSALPLRLDLIKELKRLLSQTTSCPSITMEMKLPHVWMTARRPCGLTQVTFVPVSPIRIDLTHRNTTENEQAIRRTVQSARDFALREDPASIMDTPVLEQRQKRALFVLRILNKFTVGNWSKPIA